MSGKRYMAQIAVAYAAGAMAGLGMRWWTTVLAAIITATLPWWRGKERYR